MIDNVEDIALHYGEDPEREDLRLEQHQLEHDLTWRYLKRYLTPSGSILEIGAATGRYTVGLARRGHAVTAVDLSPALIERARQRIAREGLTESVELHVADARDLGKIATTGFEAVLMMGPLYHLIEETDRRRALRQAYERLRGGGVIFSAFLSRLGVIGDLMRKSPAWIEDEGHVRSLLERGRRPDDAPQGGFRGYFARVSEIAPLHESVGFQTLAVGGVEPAISAQDESYNALRGEQRERWLDLLFEIGAEPSIRGASRHLLYVGRKPA